MNIDEFRNKMSETTDESKVPCLYCPLMVFRSDMPRIGVCKICFVKDKEKFKNYETWEHFLKVEVKTITN